MGPLCSTCGNRDGRGESATEKSPRRRGRSEGEPARRSEGAASVPTPRTPGGTRSHKVWPGTYHLGPCKEAIRECEDIWEVEYAEPGSPTNRHACPGSPSRVDRVLKSIRSGDGTIVLTANRQLGEGGQGGVWECADESPGCAPRLVAVKNFQKAKLAQEQRENCLHNQTVWHEFQLLKRLQDSGGHPGIVSCDGVVLESSFNFYIPMEHVPGVDLHERLWNGGGLDIPLDPRAVFQKLVSAIAFCHGKMIAHRDLKPSNVMLVPDASGHPSVRVMDFGFGAEVRDHDKDDGSPVRMRRPVGTPEWCAPEVLEIYRRLREQGGLGPDADLSGTPWQDEHGLVYFARPADVWSSGVMLWELLTSDPLFYRFGTKASPIVPGGATSLVRKYSSLPGSLTKPQQKLWRGIDPGARKLLQRMLVRDWKKRPTAGDVLADAWFRD